MEKMVHLNLHAGLVTFLGLIALYAVAKLADTGFFWRLNKSLKILLSVAFLWFIAMFVTGCADEAPTNGEPAPISGWPAEGQCSWEDMGMSGGCQKYIEYCTTRSGLHCTTYVVCNQALPQGCVK